jgi:hypothetical protein
VARIGIEVAKGGSMPEQPKDPIHYEMKIPPETQHSDDDEESGKGKPNDSARESDKAKDANVVSGDVKK